MRHPNLDALLALAGNLLAGLLLVSWNDFWTRHGLHFHLPGLFFLFAATRLDLRRGIIVTALTGLWLDAATPLPFGFHAFGLVLCLLVTREAGESLRFLRGLRSMLYQQAGNLALLLPLGLLSLLTLPEGTATPFPRLGLDLLVSQLLLLPVAIWFLSFQDRILQISGSEQTPEEVAPTE